MTRNLHMMVLLAISAFALIAAFTAEHLLHATPCSLCILERFPYGCVIILTLPQLFFKLESGPLKIILLECFAAILIGASLSAYHVGIEHHIWDVPTLCQSDAGLASSVEELLNTILEQDTPTCDQVGFSILGVSMATWNLLLSCGLLAFILHGWLQLKTLKGDKPRA